jgi:hypothetical protein
MSQFISIPNQEVIWKSFQRIPQTKNIPIMELHKWFQSTMGIVYSSIQANRIQNINQQQLLEYNREVVKMLMVHVKEYNNHLQPSTPLPPTQTQTQTQSNPIQPVQSDTSMQTQFYETPEERTQRIFQEKQKQFQNFHQKPDLPNPKDLFQEPTNDDADGAIQNVDALIEEYQKQREQDIPQYEPIPQPNTTSTATATVESNPVATSTNNNPSNQELQRAIQQLESRVQILEQTLANLGTFDSVSDQSIQRET